MSKNKKPPKWVDVYPAGTPEGDEESRFFISLARNPKYAWRSVAALAKESNLTKERTEEIINKYFKKGMVFQNPANEEQWGYWVRVPEMLPKDTLSIADKDKEDRINRAMNKSMTLEQWKKMFNSGAIEWKALGAVSDDQYFRNQLLKPMKFPADAFKKLDLMRDAQIVYHLKRHPSTDVNYKKNFWIEYKQKKNES